MSARPADHPTNRPDTVQTSRPIDLRVYLITDAQQCEGLGIIATVEAAVRGGVTVVQLRDSTAPDDEFIRMGQELSAALKGSGVPLIIDDRVELVEAIGADGAHVGQSDLPAEEARRVLGPDALLGLSVSRASEIDVARGFADGTIDYLGVGPVWATSSKPNHGPTIGLDGLSELSARSPWPVVAIGGINVERLASVRRNGGDGGAVISAVCGQEDPEAASAQLVAAWERGRPRA